MQVKGTRRFTEVPLDGTLEQNFQWRPQFSFPKQHSPGKEGCSFVLKKKTLQTQTITNPFLDGAPITLQLNKRHENGQDCLKRKNLGTLLRPCPPIFTISSPLLGSCGVRAGSLSLLLLSPSLFLYPPAWLFLEILVGRSNTSLVVGQNQWKKSK